MISVRLAQPAEFDQVKGLIRRIFPSAMISVSEEDTVLLAENDEGEPVGFAHVVDSGDRILFQGVGVDKSMRGRGIGTMLIEHTLSLFEDCEKPIYLKVKIMNPVIDLYSRFGFFVKRFGTTSVLVKKSNN